MLTVTTQFSQKHDIKFDILSSDEIEEILNLVR